MRGLALEGGGAKGSYQIGSYIALKKLGFKFDMIAGTSIGSLNAAIIAQGDDYLAKKIWLNVDSEIIGINKELVEIYKNFKFNKENLIKSFTEINNIIKNKGLDVSKYKELIDKYVNEDKVRKSKINYGLVTVRLNDLKPLELTIDEIEEGKLTEYILASSYLPIFKMDKIINDSYYLDGGFSNNLPITLLEKNGCNDIIAIKINGIGKNKKKNNENTNVIEITPTKDTGPIVLFNNNDVINNYNMGYYDTLLYFNKLIGFKYYFKKFRFFKFLTRKVDDKLINLIKLKYHTPNINETIIKSIEDILENNKIDYYKIYSIPKIIKYIKNNNLKSNNKLVNEFVYKLKYFY
ncbi:MAG: patatin-like phospholipase family protein [Bacilli bacterium]|nr:patatin-like phospholipase family protein [Bacilli bacterium]